MTYIINADERLRSPDYWDDIDPVRPDADSVRQPQFEVLPHEEWLKAGGWLLGALGAVLEGEYDEDELHVSAAEPVQTLLTHPDGTVVVLEREHIMSWQYSGPARPWTTRQSDSDPISAPFIRYWIANQHPEVDWSDRKEFGTESATFTDTHQWYARTLGWGVMMTGEDGDRLMPTWTFSTPKLTLEGLTVAVPDGGKKDSFVRVAEQPPLLTRQATAAPEYAPQPIAARRWPLGRTREITPGQNLQSIQTVGRLLSARVIYTSHGVLPEVPDIDSFKDGLLTRKLVSA